MRQITSLKCVQMMAYDARMASSITSSSLFRVVDEMGVTLTIDEADNVLRDEKSDLLGIMNAGRDRMTARVMRAESVGDGKFKVREFNTFAPIALTSIRALPATLQDRAIVADAQARDARRAAGALNADGARPAHRYRPASGALGDRPPGKVVTATRADRPVQPDRGRMVRPLSGRRGWRAANGRSGAARRPGPILRAKKRMTPTAAGTPICLPMCGRSFLNRTR